jgi:hypothetical protein
MRPAARLLCAALLLAAGACKDRKKGPPDPAAAGSGGAQETAASGSPASEPDLPDPLSLDCARIVPEPVRAAELAGLAAEPTIQPPIATCSFGAAGGAARPSVSLFCHRRKRDWDFTDELARDPRKTAVAGVGRAAYARGDHLFFYPSKLDCLARVIWPADPARAAALARAVDAHLSVDTVTAAPAR